MTLAPAALANYQHESAILSSRSSLKVPYQDRKGTDPASSLGENPLSREQRASLGAIQSVPSGEPRHRQRTSLDEAEIGWKSNQILCWNDDILLEDSIIGVSK